MVETTGPGFGKVQGNLGKKQLGGKREADMVKYH